MPELKKIKTCIFLTCMLFTSIAQSINFNSSQLILNCPRRGIVEILFHVYGHTQEVWRNNFETGSGHKVINGIEVVQFANGDIMFHNIKVDRYSLYYNNLPYKLNECIKISERTLNPINLPVIN